MYIPRVSLYLDLQAGLDSVEGLQMVSIFVQHDPCEGKQKLDGAALGLDSSHI